VNLRQIALVAQDLPPTRDIFFEVLGVEEGFVDPGVAEFGLHNIVMRVGDTYLEVVSPIQEGTAAGRLLERRAGDGGYMVIVQVDDLAAEQARLEAHDITIAWQTDLGKARAIHLHPKDVPGAIASMDQMTPPKAWYWSGDDWQNRPRARHVATIIGAQIQSADPEATAGRWSLAYDRPLIAVAGIPTLRLDQGEVRFVEDTDGRGSGLQALDLVATNWGSILSAAERHSLAVVDRSITICGTVFNFR
jgi:hypothetical protein